MNDITMGFGLRDNTPVTLAELPITQYGLRCGLTCAECGNPIEAVRRSADHPEQGWKCFRHHKGATTSCTGYGENSCHMLAEHILQQMIGETILLPAIGARDADPHISRYTDSGSLRDNWYEPITNNPVDCMDIWYGINGEKIPDLVARPATEAKLIHVIREQRINCGLIPDLLIDVEINGHVQRLAFEIRYSHAKNLADVKRYTQTNMPVIECWVKDISVHDADSTQRLKNRLAGRDGHIEYLYQPNTKSMIDHQYRLAWSCGSHTSALRQLVNDPRMKEWKDCADASNETDVIAEKHLDPLHSSVYISIADEPVRSGGSIYTLPSMMSTLSAINREGFRVGWGTKYTPDLDSLRLINMDCWKCHRKMTVWWMSNSRPYPNECFNRIEQYDTTYERVRSLNPDYPLAVIKNKYAKGVGSRYRAFCCPYCYAICGDRFIKDEYNWRIYAETHPNMRLQIGLH